MSAQQLKLVIHKATYSKNTGADITQKVRDLVAANSGSLIIDARADFNKLFGDTEPGADKLFHVVYSYGAHGAQKSMTHAEKHNDIYLPGLEIKAGQVLTVNVLKAVGLRDTRTLGKQNPYAKLTCGSESFKTKVHEKGGTNADWNQSFIFNLDGKDQYMHVVVYDKETLSDDVIGRFDIPLPSLALGTGEVAYNLVHPNDFKKVAGSILLKCEFKDPNAPVIAAAATAAAPAPAPAAAPAPAPVVQQQPQVVYVQQPQQPQVVYQQPQVVYQQPQVVYQQPQVVYQQPQPQVVYQPPQPQVVYQPPVTGAAPAVVYQAPAPAPAPAPTPVQQITKSLAAVSIGSGPAVQIGARAYIKNLAHNKYLSCDGQKMRMGAGPDSWEVWTIVPAANGKFGLLNEQFKKYASARQDATCTPMGVLDSWEMFYTAHGKNGVEFRTEHKTNLSSDGNGVHCSPNSDSWESWAIEYLPNSGAAAGSGLRPGRAYIRNCAHNKWLALNADQPWLGTGKGDWELWEITSAPGGKWGFYNVAHKRWFGACPDGSVKGSPALDSWEMFDVVPAKLGTGFKSAAFGTHISCDGNKPYVGPNTLEWESWEVQYV